MAQAVRTLGRRLFELTNSVEAMGDICERVADRDPKYWHHRVDVIDKRWDGIGSDKDGRWHA